MADTTQVVLVPLKEIHIDQQFNCRGEIAPIDVAGLAQDIDRQGLIEPVIVMEYPQSQALSLGFKYKLIAGYRRSFAFKILRRTEIPAIVRPPMSDIDARILNLTENLMREDLNMYQEALAIKPLKDLGLVQEDIARRIGKSRGWLQARYYLLDLPQEIQTEAAAGLLTSDHIFTLRKFKTKEEQFAAVRKIKDAKLRGEKVHGTDIKPPPTNVKKNRLPAELNKMREHIQQVLGNNLTTRVLAWAVGNITTDEVFGDILEQANESGIKYSPPINGL